MFFISTLNKSISTFPIYGKERNLQLESSCGGEGGRDSSSSSSSLLSPSDDS